MSTQNIQEHKRKMGEKMKANKIAKAMYKNSCNRGKIESSF